MQNAECGMQVQDLTGDRTSTFTAWETHVAQQTENIRVLIAKVGLDGHDRGVKVVARCLRDAGMDVIYTGLHRASDEVVDAAIQEDVDILGISLLSGAHMTIFPKVIERLKQESAEDIILVGGGVIPDEDVVELKKMGVKEILLQDTPPQVIVETMKRLVAERGAR
jgi:methylmalonyl-CoA mutase C-terminal domain/subunit